MRLKVIDYDAMRTAFDKKFKETYHLIQNGETHLDNLAEGFHEADCVIWSLPTIESEPVRHGKWINIDTNECWACARYNQQEGKCDTWCDHGECFELHPVLKNAPKGGA